MPDRILKESICTSETLNELSDFEERFWTRLLVNCDDYGRFDARPAVLKARLFPLREGLTLKNVVDALSRLASVGLVELYEVDGRSFLRVVTWERYQRVRAKHSKFPAPDGACRHMPTSDGKCPRNANAYSNANAEAISARTREEAEAGDAISDYLDRINPTPSPLSLGELRDFAVTMGAAVCKRAFDIALDNRKTSWAYIRAILRDKQNLGVRCLADWDALEAEREARNSREEAPAAPSRPKRYETRVIDGREVDVEVPEDGG